MTPIEIYEQHEYLVRLAVWQFFGSKRRAKKIATHFGCEYEDFISIARTKLWEMALKHDSNEHKNFNQFATTAIHFKLSEFTKRKQSLLKLPMKNARELQRNLNISSMDKEMNGEYHTTLHDVIPSNVSVENYVIRKMELEERLSVLKERDRQILCMFLNGMLGPEIAEKLGKNYSYIRTLKVRAVEKASRAI